MVDQLIKLHNDLFADSDPRTAALPFTSTTSIVAATTGYLLVVAALVAWTKRLDKPFNMKYVTILHNLNLLVLSAYMAYEASSQALKNNYKFWGNGVDRSPKGDGMARIVYIFYLSKFVEFGDTVIMALKKNYHQITWLHVYHHWSISIIWHIIARVAPGGDAYFSTALNSFVHVIMYAYYCWSALYSKKDKSGAPAKPNWTEPAFYKKYITSMQMLQFVSMMAQALYDIVVPNPYPRFLAWTLFIYMITMLALFGNFFTKSYSKSKAGKDE